MTKGVVLGVSGGIDSAATSFMLRKMGYHVVGVHMVMTDEDMVDAKSRHKEMEALLGIEVRLYDAREQFNQEIINPFIESYLSARTPSPCTWCNRIIKWQILKDVAQELGFSKWATGHYCQIVEHSGKLYISKGVDPSKDQSYYLWALDQETLAGAIMPLGAMLKSQVRELAQEEFGLSELTKKRESMSLCFLKGKSYHSLIESQYTPTVGDIVDASGSVVGSHNGYPLYTIAQKKGLTMPSGLCVTAIDPANNRLVAGRSEDLLQKNFILDQWQATDNQELLSSSELVVKVRGIGRNPDGYCSVAIREDGGLDVCCQNDAWAVCSGQPAVFFIGDRVIGGGYVR